MPRKRPRTGNRSDRTMAATQPVRTATGQSYGAATAQREAQNVVPLPQQQVPRLDLNRVTEAARNAPVPQGLLGTPTENPDEPVTAGLPFGEGPGPEILGVAPDPVEAGLRALYQAYPNEALRRLLEIQVRSRDTSSSLPSTSGTSAPPGMSPPTPTR